MKNMTLAHITEVCGGIYFGPEEKKTAEVTDIVTDSRKAGEGSLFVAIPGERVDGHKFIPNVASQGALAVISEQKLETPPCPYILVKDSMEAIKAMAEYYMQQLNIPVVGKLMLASYQYKQGKKIDSSMLTANAINMRNDVVISAGVLLGLIFTFIFKLPILDSITGLIISLFIIKSSIGIFLDSNVELMDGVKDVNVYNKIFEAVEKVPGASNPHRVRSRMIGNRYIITLDIEVNPQITITQAHEIAGAVEKSIESSIDNVYDILVHVEPAGECQTDEKFGVDKDMV